MLTVLTFLGVLAALFFAAALATREGEQLRPAPPDAADLNLPEGTLRAEDVAGVRLGLAPRGYRMSEVDAVLARVSDELAARDAELARLRAGSAGPVADQPTAGEPATPVGLEKAAAEPVAADPAAADPVEPAAAHPLATEKAAAEPVAAEPATSPTAVRPVQVAEAEPAVTTPSTGGAAPVSASAEGDGRTS